MTRPFVADAAVIVIVSLSGSESFANTSIWLLALSSNTVLISLTATGASFTAETVIDTVAAAESTVPSLTLKVKESEPLKLSAGVYVRFGAVPDKVPFAGCVTTVYVKLSPSLSAPAKVIVLSVSSVVVTDCDVAAGGVFVTSIYVTEISFIR